jgi:hypothetical protein
MIVPLVSEIEAGDVEGKEMLTSFKQKKSNALTEINTRGGN